MDAVEELANIAQKVNEETDNIDSSFAYHLEKLLEELLFEPVICKWEK